MVAVKHLLKSGCPIGKFGFPQRNGAQQEQIEEEIMSLIKMNMDSAVDFVQSITVRSHVISTRALFLIVYKHFIDKKLLFKIPHCWH